MKTLKSILIMSIFTSQLAYSAISELQPVSFGGGVDYKSDCSEIRNDRSCDESNMISDYLGTAFKRNGSKRYITQAVSTNPVNSTIRVYQSTGATTKKALIMTSWDGIYKSTGDITPYWIKIDSGLAHNQHFSFVAMKNKIIMTGDRLTDPIKQLDITVNTSTPVPLIAFDPSTTSINVNIRAKYNIQSRNYYIAGNVADITAGTTYYPSRLFYSLLDIPSSMTALRYIDYRTDDGEEITGMGELFGRVHIFKPSSIGELSFTILNLIANGGDQILTPIVQGFGLLAPRTLANTGQFYIFLAKDGIRMWDGGRRNRLTVTEESRIISTNIEPVIKDIIRYNTFNNCSGIYYPKKQWYIFSYEDANKFPRGRANSVMIYDLVTGEWHPQKNWNAECFAIQDGITDNGELFYGDSTDGYVYLADREQNQNDARKEISIDNMDSTSTWVGGSGKPEWRNVVEGSASLKMTLSAVESSSSISKSAVIDIGAWSDQTKVTKSDLLEFKVLVTSLTNLTSLRVDLEVNNNINMFDQNFTSVTISSTAIANSSTPWATIGIALSSFPILDNWVNISSEAIPFANTLTFYGIRFVATSPALGCNVYIDDVRVVQGTENPLNSFRTSKQFNYGTSASKRWRQLILSAEKSADSKFFVDVFTDFGQFSKRIEISTSFAKELYVSGLGGRENVSRINSVDFSVIQATESTDRSYSALRPITVDEKFIYGGDHYNNRIVKISKSSMTSSVFVSTFGSFGSGTTTFNVIYQMAVDDGFLYVCDFGNNRVKVHDKNNLKFVNAFGTLGNGATSFHNPSGVAVDDTNLFVANDGNYSISKLNKTTGKYIDSVDLNLSNIGDTTLAVDDRYLYAMHQIVAPSDITYSDIQLEKRNKSDLKLINKVLIRPETAPNYISSYTITGDLGITDDYIYVSFTDDANIIQGGNFFIQKRLKSDFSLVKEYKSKTLQFAIAGNGLSWRAKRQNIVRDLESEGTYIQIKYSDNELDNSMKLYNQSLLVILIPAKE
mgnify:CR=1 FL=1